MFLYYLKITTKVVILWFHRLRILQSSQTSSRWRGLGLTFQCASSRNRRTDSLGSRCKWGGIRKARNATTKKGKERVRTIRDFPSLSLGYPLFSAFLASPIPRSLFALATQATEPIVQYIQDSLYQNRTGQDLGFVYHKVEGDESGNLST